MGVTAINKMLDHVHDVDERISQIGGLLNAEARNGAPEIPPLEPCTLDNLEVAEPATAKEKDSPSE